MALSLYLDPRHDKSLRVVLFHKNIVYIHGVFDNDDPSKESWMVSGTKKEEDTQYTIDFGTKTKHKGKQLLDCTLLKDKNILWEDGNQWIYLPSNLSNNCEKKKLFKKFLILKKLL